MAIVSVRIPQIGEGLQEARLVAVLKQPGDTIRRDEPIYQMETDKAVMDVESPFDGVLIAWTAPVDSILPIGGEVATMEVADAKSEASAVPTAAPTAAPAAAPTAVPGEQGDSALQSVRIPQIGEGLQEARLVAVLKQAGDYVKRDEPIYQMETDKAVMDVESPFEGVLVEWLAKVDEVLPIGAEVARMRVEGAVQVTATPHAPASVTAAPSAERTPGSTSRNANIPPRTRAYAKEKGLSEVQLETMPSVTGKLMPSDVDVFLAQGAAVAVPAPARVSNANFEESPLNQKQRLLASRLVRGNQLVVPGTISVAANWEPIEGLRAKIKAGGGDFQPSTFTMFAFAVAKVLADFPAFRSSLVGDATVRQYKTASLGIAVSLPGDDLVIAVIERADQLDWRGFASAARAKIDLARTGKDQANESVTVSVTNMQNAGLRDAVAVVVPPSIATLFLGEVYNGLAQNTKELRLQRCANISLTFDHRLINGVGAAQFINAIKQRVEAIEELIS